MTNFNQQKEELSENGFSIIENCFDKDALSRIIDFITENNFDFSERQLLNRFPELQEIIFENKLFKELLREICFENSFLSKAIYFNKPSNSNWFVSYHQDISISAKKKNLNMLAIVNGQTNKGN